MASAENTALLVMDVQSGIVDNFESDGPLEKLETAIGAAREHDVPVIYIVVGFRKGHPEVHPRNKLFGGIKESGGMVGTGAEAIPDAVAPRDGELVIQKKRVSAFAGSDLEMVLAAQEIHHLVLTGISASGVVLSTLRYAADRDFQLTVLSDCVADRDEEVKRVLLGKVFPRQADVVEAAEWVAGLG